MSYVDIILVGAVVLLTFGHIVHILVGKTRVERVENSVSQANATAKEALEQANQKDLSNELVDLHRKLMQLQTVTENQELRLTDIADTLEHRFNRLRMRQSRARQEEGEEEPQVDPETAQQLLMELNGAQPQEEEQRPPRRGRLVAKYARDKYTRR